MKKINNKGMTIIEVLVCFVLVAIISTSMYNSISNFNDRRNLESMKEKILNVKNLYTKQIEDDIVKKGLVFISDPIPRNGSFYIDNNGLHLGGSCPANSPVGTCVQNGKGQSIQLTFKDRSVKEIIAIRDTDGTNYILAYGGAGNYMYEQLPNVGRTDDGKLALRLGEINMSTSGGNVLSVDIRFDHPQLSEKYGIRINALVNMDSYDR